MFVTVMFVVQLQCQQDEAKRHIVVTCVCKDVTSAKLVLMLVT
jgi:hypothetical protein